MKRPSQREQPGMESAEKYIQRAMNESSKIPLRLTKLSPPSWYDEEKFRRGQQFIRENYFVVSASELLVIFIFLIEPKFDKLFTMTGKYDTFKIASHHLALFFNNFRSWLDGNIYEKESRPYKTINRAAITHMKSSLTYVDDEMGISQKDMISGIFCHIWLVILEYDYFYDDADEFDRTKFEGFVHYWRVIGYHLGQVDEFNLCDGTAHEVRKKCEQVFQHIFKPVLDNPPPQDDCVTFIHLLNIVNRPFQVVDKDGLIEWVRRIHKLPHKPLKNKKSRIFVSLMIFVQEKLLKSWCISSIARPILNYLAKMIEDFL